MDNFEKPDSRDPLEAPWLEDSDSDQSFGASGVFSKVKAAEPSQGAAAGIEGNSSVPGPSRPDQARTFPSNPLAEPVVHKVVLGGKPDETAPGILNRMRIASEEKKLAEERPPVADPVSRESGPGEFTALFRSLGSASPSKPAADPPQEPCDSNSGFTALLRASGSTAGAPSPFEEPLKIEDPGKPSFAADRQDVPPSGSDGFTALFRGASGKDVETGGGQKWPLEPAERASGPVRDNSAEKGNDPGEFTRLFKSFGASESSLPESRPESHGLDVPPAEDRGSYAGPSSASSYSPSSSFGAEARTGNRDPFFESARPVEPPAPSESPESGVGLTRLIRMLDEQARPQEQRIGDGPAKPQPASGPGPLTSLYDSVASQSTRNASALRATDQQPAALRDPAFNSSPPSAGGAGPSEFTRIFNASRMRESDLKGKQPAQAESAARTQPPPPPPQAPQSVPMPGFAIPPMPSAGIGPGGMPQVYGAPGVQTPMMPGGQANRGSAGMPGQMGMMPMQPAIFAPPPALPPTPQPSPAPAGQPGTGKMQKYVPLMLMVIIFLLIGLLVTVIFLMKH